jgi:pimeloyl-ACP methyl ester carboxylesterase
VSAGPLASGAARVRVRGVDLHVEAWGSGPTLVVAHGLLGSVDLAGRFGAPPRAFADHGLHVVAYDARGHGRSGFSAREADYRWTSHAADLVELLRALGVRRASLLGGSMGAGSALLVALAHPELVERLVLVAPPPFGAALGVARRTFLPLAFLYRLFGAHATARIVTALPSVRRLQRQNPRNDLFSFFASQRRASVVPAIRGLLRERDPLPMERFQEIAHQTLVFVHPGDPIHPLGSGELLEKTLPRASVRVAPSTTYWQEHPEIVAREVAAFVRDGLAQSPGEP